MKVYVGLKCVKFAPFLIDAYLGRNNSTDSEKVISMDNIAREITVGQVKNGSTKDYFLMVN